MRDRSVDEYIESIFGKPDWSKTVIENEKALTLLGEGKLAFWRVDTELEWRADHYQRGMFNRKKRC